MRLFTTIKKLICALLLGIIVTLFILQKQNRFKNIVKEKLQTFLQQSYDCEVDFEIANINMFFPSIQISNVIIKEKQNNNWNWKCDSIKFSCSWIDFIFRKQFYSTLEINNFLGYSIYKDNNLAILPHIKKLFAVDSDFPMVLKNAYMNNASIVFYEPNLKLKSYLNWNSHSRLVENSFKTNIYFNNGNLEKDGESYFNNLSGSLQATFESNSIYPILKYDLLGNCNILKLSDNRCFLQGKLQDNISEFKFGTLNGQMKATSIISDIYNKCTTKIDLSSSLSCISKVAQIDLPYEGQCTTQLNFDLNNWQNSLQGNLNIKDLFNTEYPSLKIDELNILFNKKRNLTKGNLDILYKKFKFLGNYSWDENTGLGNLHLNNNSLLSIENQDWTINPKDFSIKLNFNKNFKINGNYKFKIQNSKLEKNISCHGNINYLDNIFKLNGNFANKTLTLECQLKPQFIINNFLLKDENGKDCISIITNLENKPYSTSCLIHYQNIKNWFVDDFHPFLSGEGLIRIDGNLSKDNFAGKISLSQGSLKLINIQNIIKEFESSIGIDFNNKSLTIQDLILNLNKGSIECKKGVLLFGDIYNKLEPDFIHFPLILKSCFVNWKNDFFARINGRILLQKKLQKNLDIDGNLIIYNSQIKNNIFSKDFNKEFFFLNPSNQTSSIDANLNLSIVSKNPIKIKTTFFESQANLNLNITKTILNPEISGQIELTGGSIIFPYKPLNIVSGSVNFINDSKDPIIHLIAKNKIQNFTITMQIMGSVNDPKIIFESSPVLSDEQIGSLLIAGTEKASLNLVMPTLLLQNIKNIILGSSSTYSKVEKYIHKFLKPFKNVRILPTFTDDKGVGFQGALEIDLTDRLHANIKKNFSSSEDTKLEVDYTLTDDISLRGVKDEQGNLGGELEVRWKL